MASHHSFSGVISLYHSVFIANLFTDLHIQFCFSVEHVPRANENDFHSGIGPVGIGSYLVLLRITRSNQLLIARTIWSLCSAVRITFILFGIFGRLLNRQKGNRTLREWGKAKKWKHANGGATAKSHSYSLKRIGPGVLSPQIDDK